MHWNFKKVIAVLLTSVVPIFGVAQAADPVPCVLNDTEIPVDATTEQALGITFGISDAQVKLESIKIIFPKYCFDEATGLASGYVCAWNPRITEIDNIEDFVVSAPIKVQMVVRTNIDATSLNKKLYNTMHTGKFAGNRDRFSVFTPGLVQRSQKEAAVPVHFDWEDFTSSGPKVRICRVLGDFSLGMRQRILPGKTNPQIGEDISLNAFISLDGISVDCDLFDWVGIPFKLMGVDVVGKLGELIATDEFWDKIGENPIATNFLGGANLSSLNESVKSIVGQLGTIYADNLSVSPESGFSESGTKLLLSKQSKQDFPDAYVDVNKLCRPSSSLHRVDVARNEVLGGAGLTHTVLANETLELISERYFGSKSMYPEFVALNKLKNPDKLKPGQKLLIPSGKASFTKRAVIVEEGDTLKGIWEQNFADLVSYKDFRKRNSQPGFPGRIYPGMYVYAD